MSSMQLFVGKAEAAVLFGGSDSMGSLHVVVKALLPLELPSTALHRAHIFLFFVSPVHCFHVLAAVARAGESPTTVLFGTGKSLIPVCSSNVISHVIHPAVGGATVQLWAKEPSVHPLHVVTKVLHIFKTGTTFRIRTGVRRFAQLRGRRAFLQQLLFLHFVNSK